MRFIILANNCLPFHAFTLDQRPIGGTETGVIRLSNALHQLGHEVKVFTTDPSPPASTPPYFPLSQIENERETDVLLSVRAWLPLFLPIRAKKRMYWTGDSYDQISTVGIGDKRVADKIDALLTVSAWHATTLSAQSQFPIERTWVIRNGIHLPYFEGSEQRRRKRLIYSSTPYRGLNLVPALYDKLHRQHPDLELMVFSGYEVYRGEDEYLPEAQKEWLQLKAQLEQLPGCTVQGNVTQSHLAREFMKSSLLFYPNTFEETCCITAMEAQAGGCTIVTSDSGALRETVGDAGFVIPGRPGTSDYSERFLKAADRLLSDEALFQECSRNGQERAKKEFDWNIVASRFENYLMKIHGL